MTRIEMNEPAGVVAKFGAEVFSLGLKLGDDGGVGAQPDVQVLEGVVVDEIELDVFIAAAFPGGRVGCAQEIEFGAFLFDRLLLGFSRFFGRLFNRFGRLGRCGLLGQEKQDPESKLEHVDSLCQGWLPPIGALWPRTG
jgi:hypothetical protein